MAGHLNRDSASSGIDSFHREINFLIIKSVNYLIILANFVTIILDILVPQDGNQLSNQFGWSYFLLPVAMKLLHCYRQGLILCHCLQFVTMNQLNYLYRQWPMIHVTPHTPVSGWSCPYCSEIVTLLLAVSLSIIHTMNKLRYRPCGYGVMIHVTPTPLLHIYSIPLLGVLSFD